MRFQAVILSTGKTATGIEVPVDVVASLEPSQKPPVRVTINGYTYRSTVGSRGDRFLIGVSAENRERSGVVAGDMVDVDVELDTEPRSVTVPADLARALRPEPEAKWFFDGLSYSTKQWFVLSVEGAKTAETRQRRIEKAVAMLREGRAR
jgi:Bacteriocin-protection, YdeI or OmpD-Associated/Domain of unknown function (DUF1905)